jgi:hypothetical protein
VSTMPKYRKPNKPVVAAPIIYIFLRPMRSEMWPDRGMVMRETQEATITALHSARTLVFDGGVCSSLGGRKVKPVAETA